MPKIHVECPSCHAKLATSGRNEGKQGVCPECEKTLDLRANRAKTADGAAASEYSEPLTARLALVLAATLLLLALTTAMSWASINGSAASSLLGQKAGVAAGSLACAGFIAFSLFGRKSPAPAALVSAAWALGAVIWVSGTLSMLRMGEEQLPAEAAGVVEQGIHVTIGAACLAFGLALALAVHLRDSRTFRNVPAYLGGLLVVGLVCGFLGVIWHVRPALSYTVARAVEPEPEPIEEPPPVRVRPPVQVTPPDNGNDDDDDEQPSTGNGETGEIDDRQLAVWVEGERARESSYSNAPWYDTQIRTTMLSGSAWESHFHPTRSASANWQFQAPEAGDYNFWLRCNPFQTTMTYSLNGGQPVDIATDEVAGQRHSLSPDEPDYRFVAWVKVGTVALKKGTNRITITQDGLIAHSGGVDCMLFINDDWRPSGGGLIKPPSLRQTESQ